MNLRQGIVILFLFGFLQGCIGYHNQPLDKDTINRALASPDHNTLIEEARQLPHPRLSPIQLDFNKPLSAQELAVIAVLVNPDLKALRAKEGVAQAQVFNAGLLPDPQLNFNLSHPIHQTPIQTADMITGMSLGLSWDFASLITRQTQLKIEQAKYQQTHYDVAWQEWLLANQAELLATRSYFLEKQLNLMRQAIADAKHLLDITQRNLELHDVKIDEFGLRQTAYLDLVDQTQSLAQTLKQTQLQLNQILGLKPFENLPLHIEPLAVPRHLNADNLFQEAQEYRLDLFALRAGYASQEAQLYQAILGQFPHFGLNVARARDTSDIHTWDFGISFDIPLFNRNRGVIAIAKATRQQLYLEYLARLSKTRSDIAALVADLNQLCHTQEILEREVPRLEKAEALMRQGLNDGNVTLISYQDVRMGLINKKLKLLAIKQGLAEQMIALQIAVGRIWE